MLWPDSAVVNYYLGEALHEANREDQARIPYQTAWQLGDAQVHVAMRFFGQFSSAAGTVVLAAGEQVGGPDPSLSGLPSR